MTTTETSSSDDHRARAIAKLHLELKKDVKLARSIAGACGVWELLRFCYLCRINRTLRLAPEYLEQPGEAQVAQMQLADDSMKYAIALIGKHGSWKRKLPSAKDFHHFRNERCLELDRQTRYVNAKFESEILLHIAEVRVSGERDQECELNLAEGLKDPQRAMHFEFGLRIERATKSSKDDLLTIEVLVERLRRDYRVVEDQFKADAGLSLDQFCDGMLSLHQLLRARAQAQEVHCALKENGRVDLEAKTTFIAMSMAFVLTNADLAKALSSEFVGYIKRNAFDGTQFSDSELRFHYLTRRPFFVGDGFFILSPELIFDSLFDNAHFSLLESDSSKDEYKKRRAIQFVDEVARIALTAGYSEVARDLDLTEGKQQIGDIDLVLRNETTGHTLLVEAKNHSLPLPVYFRSPTAVEEHVARTRDWEKKVQRRIQHLGSSSSSYAVGTPWDYIIVSNMPEPLAHVTPLLVLSLREFTGWVSQEQRPSKFADFYQAFYETNEPTMSKDELESFIESGFSLARPNLD